MSSAKRVFWPENEYCMYQGSHNPSHLAQVLAEEITSNRLYSCRPSFWPVILDVCIENKAMQREEWTICKGWKRMHVFNICLFGARFLCSCLADLGREITKPTLPEAWKMDVSYQLRGLWRRWWREMCMVCLPTASQPASTASVFSSLIQVSWATIQCISVCCSTNSSCGFQADK